MPRMRFRYKDENGKWSNWLTEDQLEELKGKYVLAIHTEELMYREDAIRYLKRFSDDS